MFSDALMYSSLTAGVTPLLFAGALAALFIGFKAKVFYPPVVSSGVHWQDSTVDFERDSETIIKRARRTHGDIFGVTLSGETMYFITTPTLFQKIYKHPKTYATKQRQWRDDIFGIKPHLAITLPPIVSLMHEYLSPKLLPSLLERTNFYANVSLSSFSHTLPTQSQSTSPSATIDLLPFILEQTYRATTLALFGPTFEPFITPSFESFWRFDSKLPLIAKGYPLVHVPSHARTRGELHKILEQYLSLPRLIPQQHPSELVSKIENAAREAGWNKSDTASFLVSVLWRIMSNTPWTVYWLLILQLQRPEGLAELTKEVDEKRREWSAQHPGQSFTAHLASGIIAPEPQIHSPLSPSGASASASTSTASLVSLISETGGPSPPLSPATEAPNPFQSLIPRVPPSALLTSTPNPAFPLLASAFHETIRYASDAYSIRTVTTPFATVGGYTFKQSDTLVCHTRSANMDGRVFRDPEVFEPRRFLDAEFDADVGVGAGVGMGVGTSRSGESLRDSDSGFASVGAGDDTRSVRNAEKVEMVDMGPGSSSREGNVQNAQRSGFVPLPFGFGDGNPGKCAGRAYAHGVFTIITALILTRFHIELEPEAEHEHGPRTPPIAGRSLGQDGLVKFSPCNRGLGIIRPKGDLKVRISTREWSS
ncbi:hypothetical protein BOTBODRAFT_250135 [Botryobasidium botryosum FD-172 SS1]|uniref:Cytochrome P450 n=1 Tax=Botryobasidium botryosum (strain FD-172 SS1) TaxID=930990 RepID=A0A067MP36_BOTB1|nr:hypothetical protein BOTBODRAFT_250135 [Botryobasidium botryosum FD-172 SS1]